MSAIKRTDVTEPSDVIEPSTTDGPRPRPGPWPGSPGRPAVEIIGVRKQFAGRSRRSPGRPALDGFDLTVAPGEFLCLLGPSGCGKSTLLNMLAGFSLPDGGQVLTDGRPVTGPGPDRGVLFQTPTLFPWLTTLGNVLYGPRARHELDAGVRERALALLQTVGLADSRDAYPHELSGGMRHRAAFARVLVNRPRLLLMDEPFGALDPLTRAEMQDMLRELMTRMRKTVLLVTHDLNEALYLGNEIMLMSEGKLIASLSAEQFLQSQEPQVVSYVQAFYRGAQEAAGSEARPV